MTKNADKENALWYDKSMKKIGGSGALYGLGFIGALIYYIQTAPNLWTGIVGFFKALVWPAFLVYEVFRRLGM
jgi:hypothetical protein